jgi:hypothetical protein
LAITIASRDFALMTAYLRLVQEIDIQGPCMAASQQSNREAAMEVQPISAEAIDLKSRLGISLTRLRRYSHVAFALMVTSCASDKIVSPTSLIPPAGSKASAVSDDAGVATLRLGDFESTIRVVDAAGAPAGGIQVAATVGSTMMVVIAVDPANAHPPAMVVHPVADVAAFSHTSISSPQAAARAEPITMTLLVIGGALGLWELVSDPVHQSLVIDEGLLKTCIVGDLKDLKAFLDPIIGLGTNHVIVSVLSKSKTFALSTDVGLFAVSALIDLLEFMDKDRVLPYSCTILVGDSNFNTQLVVLAGVTGGGILSQDDRLASTVYFVEPSASGSDFALKAMRDTQGSSLRITDIAYWDKPVGQVGGSTLSNPIVYVVSPSRLYQLNRATGVGEQLASFGSRTVNALTFDKDGGLYAGGSSGELLVIDPVTGALKQAISLSPAVQFSGDLIFLANGMLVATVTGGVGGDRLAEIDRTTGIVRMIGNIGFDGVYGLSLFDGSLWGLTKDAELLRLNSETGRGTLVRSLSFNANGARVQSMH